MLIRQSVDGKSFGRFPYKVGMCTQLKSNQINRIEFELIPFTGWTAFVVVVVVVVVVVLRTAGDAALFLGDMV